MLDKTRVFIGDRKKIKNYGGKKRWQKKKERLANVVKDAFRGKKKSLPKKGYIGLTYEEPKVGARLGVMILQRGEDAIIRLKEVETSTVQYIAFLNPFIAIIRTKNSYYIVRLMRIRQTEEVR